MLSCYKYVVKNKVYPNCTFVSVLFLSNGNSGKEEKSSPQKIWSLVFALENWIMLDGPGLDTCNQFPPGGTSHTFKKVAVDQPCHGLTDIY